MRAFRSRRVIRRDRRGYTIFELLAAVAILAVLFATVPTSLAVLGSVERSQTMRQFALLELANLHARAAAGQQELTLREEAAAVLSDADLTVDRTPRGDWETLSLTLSWTAGPEQRQTETLAGLLPVANVAAGEDEP